ncbi:hypothetical protein FPV67DRAFT_1460081 [Lyophyllum atratum]|nr:hypothetical protein FPV67DRAFT_1460081 [Lyophyllum atratum]
MSRVLVRMGGGFESEWNVTMQGVGPHALPMHRDCAPIRRCHPQEQARLRSIVVALPCSDVACAHGRREAGMRKTYSAVSHRVRKSRVRGGIRLGGWRRVKSKVVVNTPGNANKINGSVVRTENQHERRRILTWDVVDPYCRGGGREIVPLAVELEGRALRATISRVIEHRCGTASSCEPQRDLVGRVMRQSNTFLEGVIAQGEHSNQAWWDLRRDVRAKVRRRTTRLSQKTGKRPDHNRKQPDLRLRLHRIFEASGCGSSEIAGVPNRSGPVPTAPPLPLRPLMRSTRCQRQLRIPYTSQDLCGSPRRTSTEGMADREGMAGEAHRADPSWGRAARLHPGAAAHLHATSPDDDTHAAHKAAAHLRAATSPDDDTTDTSPSIQVVATACPDPRHVTR